MRFLSHLRPFHLRHVLVGCLFSQIGCSGSLSPENSAVDVRPTQAQLDGLSVDDKARQDDIVRSVGNHIFGADDRRLLIIEFLSALWQILPHDDEGSIDPSRPFIDRREFMIHHLESKYFADTAEWFDGPIRQQFEIEMSRAGLVTGRSRYLDDPGPSGPGWVIELKGHHFHNSSSRVEGGWGAVYVRSTLFRDMREKKVTLPGPDGQSREYSMSELGVGYPVLTVNSQIHHGNRIGRFPAPRYDFVVQFCWQPTICYDRLVQRKESINFEPFCSCSACQNRIATAWKKKYEKQVAALKWMSTPSDEFVHDVGSLWPIEEKVTFQPGLNSVEVDVKHRQAFSDWIKSTLPRHFSNNDRFGEPTEQIAARWNSNEQERWFDQIAAFRGAANNEGIPTTIQMLYAQESVWALESILESIRKTNAEFKTGIRLIEEISIGRRAGSSAGAIVTIRGGTSPPTTRPTFHWEHDFDLANDRYIDELNRPLSGNVTRGLAESADKRDAILMISKRLPMRVRLLMESQVLPTLLSSLAESALPVEVRQFRLSRLESMPGLVVAEIYCVIRFYNSPKELFAFEEVSPPLEHHDDPNQVDSFCGTQAIIPPGLFFERTFDLSPRERPRDE